MNVTAEWAGAAVAAGGAAFAVIKLAMAGYVDWPSHRDIDQKNKEDAKADLKIVNDSVTETRDLVKEIHGYLKAKNGGEL